MVTRPTRIILGLTIFVLLAVTLLACGAVTNTTLPGAARATNVTQPTIALPTPIPTVEPTSTLTSKITAALNSTSCGLSVDYISEPLTQEISQSQQIFLGKVVKIGDLVWNTADGKEPAKSCDFDHQQYAPVQLKVSDVYKGDLKVGANVTLLMSGAPGSKPFGNYQFFPKLGEENIWFTGENYNYRRDGGTPLIYPAERWIYRLQAGGKWKSVYNNNTLTINELKETIKNPASYPTATPPPPPPTPLVKTGETINLAKLYSLDKARSIYLKGFLKGVNAPASMEQIGISDLRFKAVLASLNRDVTVLPKVSLPDAANDWIAVGFEFSDNNSSTFSYNAKTSILTCYLPDKINQIAVPAPPNFLQTLGLK